MNRALLAVVISALIVVFVWQYASFTDRIKPEPVQIVEQVASGKYEIRIVCTFACAGNEFGIPAVRVAFRDQVLLERNEPLPAGQEVQIQDVGQVKQGMNDIHVQVNPAGAEAAAVGGAFSLEDPASRPPDAESDSIARAVRVAILRDGYEVAEQVIWSAAPGPFGELIPFRIDLNHDH